MNQTLTATETATTSATAQAVESTAEDGRVITLFLRTGSDKWNFRFRPREAARGLFNGRGDIHRSTRTGDKQEATRIAMKMIVELEADCDLYVNEFAPWATEQLRDPAKTLTCPHCRTAEDLMIRIQTGEAFRVFKEESQGHSRRLATVWLPVLPDASSQSLALPVSTKPAKVNKVVPKEATKPTVVKSSVVEGVPIETIPSIFKLCGEKRKVSNSTALDRERELTRLLEWMKDNDYSVLDVNAAYEYVEFLQEGTTYKTARKRLSMGAYPFEVAFKIGRGVGIILPFNPFQGLGVLSEGGAYFSPREAFSPSDCKAMLDNLPSAEEDPILHWIIKLGAVTGMRINAVTQLLARDIKKQEGIVCVQVSKTEGNKTDIPYWIPIHTVFADEFYSWFEANRPPKDDMQIFALGKRSGTPKIAAYLKNLDIKATPPKKLKSFHSFRHSTATWLKEVMPMEAHRNAMQGRQEQGSVSNYGTLAGVLSYAGIITTAPLWWEDDYHKRLFEKGLKVWGE